MRWGRVVTGIVLAAIGLLVVLIGAVIGGATTSASVPAGTAWTITPTALTAVTATIHWRGGNATTRVWLITGSPTCTAPAGVVANGSGGNGSFTSTLSPGTKYSLYACTGTTFQAGTFSMSASGGITILELLGLIAVAIGAVVVFFGVRSKAPPRLYDAGRDRAAAPYPGGKGVAPTDLSARPKLPPPPPRPPPAGRTMQGCPVCGKTFPAGQYSACPACGTPF